MSDLHDKLTPIDERLEMWDIKHARNVRSSKRDKIVQRVVVVLAFLGAMLIHHYLK